MLNLPYYAYYRCACGYTVIDTTWRVEFCPKCRVRFV